KRCLRIARSSFPLAPPTAEFVSEPRVSSLTPQGPPIGPGHFPQLGALDLAVLDRCSRQRRDSRPTAPPAFQKQPGPHRPWDRFRPSPGRPGSTVSEETANSAELRQLDRAPGPAAYRAPSRPRRRNIRLGIL